MCGWLHSNLCARSRRSKFFCLLNPWHWLIVGPQSYYRPATFKSAHEGPVEHMAFDPIYRRLASVGRGSLQVWDIGEDCELPPHTITQLSWAHSRFHRGKPSAYCKKAIYCKECAVLRPRWSRACILLRKPPNVRARLSLVLLIPMSP